MNTLKKIGFAAIPLLILVGCSEKYTPKPREFFRIDFPEKKYHPLPSGFPYQFDIPDYSKIVDDIYNPDQPYWINISVPANKAEIHLSYYKLSNQEISSRLLLNEFMEETRTLAYKHTIKADAIQEQVFMNPAKNVYGLIYKIEGNAASPMQFFLTDSTNHFLRGALYIRDVPNIDSLKPVIDFLEPDIIHLIETTTWN
ncbi:MAG TPA: gliding motility lipoprotein GldD [Draconibacterium sp.]|nr:gliding motility lipoprotein GldD [Draconibacterium sp.]